MSAHEISKKENDINRINFIKVEKRDQTCFADTSFWEQSFSSIFIFFIVVLIRSWFFFSACGFLQIILFIILSFYDIVRNLLNRYYSFSMNKKSCFNAIKTTIISSFTLKMWYRSKVKSLFTYAKKPINMKLGFSKHCCWAIRNFNSVF